MPQYQGIWSLQSAAQLQSTQRWVTDPLYKNTALLLQADNTSNGTQNNTFIDSSSNNFTITRNGNTTQGTFTPYSSQPGAWSNYFGGAGSYLSNTSTALIGSTVSTFTAEAWIYMTAVPSSDANNIGSVVSLDGQANGTINYMAFGPISNQKLFLRWFDGAGKTCNGSTTLALNTWYHIALVVNSNAISMYVNGAPETLSGTTTLTNRSGTINEFAVARNNYSAFFGYISNLRVTSTALYTSAFTPSTLPLTSPSGTVLLTCQSNRFFDANTQTTAKTLTSAGTATSAQAFSPFTPQYQWTAPVIGGSGYFDGTGDYLSATANSAFNPGASTNPFSIECWLYPTSTPAENRAVYGNFKVISYPSNCDGFDMLYATSRILAIRWGYPAYADSSASPALNLNTWNHVVVCRNSSGSMSCFLNGSRWFNTSSNTTITNSTASSFWVGWAGDLSGTTIPPFPGYIAGFKMLNGTTAYDPTQTTLTVPAAPPTNTTNTSFLLNFTNAGIYDSALKNNFETRGNAQISTSVVKYGTGSMYFDGTTDWLSALPNDLLSNWFSGDYTIEYWIYANAFASSINGGSNVYGQAAPLGSGEYFSFGPRASGEVIFYYYNGASQVITAGTMSSSTWTHLAFTYQKASNTVRIFIDGILRASSSITGTPLNGATDTATPIIVGHGASSSFNGYIDDLRVTNGAARYTANFTPPTVALPRQ